VEEKDAMTKDQDNTRDRSESQKKGEEKKKQRLFFINLKKKFFTCCQYGDGGVGMKSSTSSVMYAKI